MKIIRKAGVAAIAAGILGVLSASPASAQGNWDNLTSCTELTNGRLYTNMHIYGAGQHQVYDYYKKTGGSTISAVFGHTHNGVSHYSPAISISSGQTKGYYWNPWPYGDCTWVYGFMNANGSHYPVPPVNVC